MFDWTALWGWVSTFGGVVGAMGIAWFFPPFRRYAIYAALAIAVAGGVYLKIRHDAREELLGKIEKEKADAIAKADKARDRIRDLCNAAPARCVPDDWFRD